MVVSNNLFGKINIKCKHCIHTYSLQCEITVLTLIIYYSI